MDIRLNQDNELEYVFENESMTEHQADVAAFILNVFRENYGDDSSILWTLVDELDLTIGEAKEITNWKLSNFEELIMEHFD
jgi:hypothetical protein